ncbi:hypothetical protein MRB53_004066 [Persea americana]|uniref:Uncharacterized protein n=1 Tax=Persea americana TaxID=3435 RepID=A0ACC2N021_PERAE|nr:hypothetical protein MRB53_004066 [Persea americana]
MPLEIVEVEPNFDDKSAPWRTFIANENPLNKSPLTFRSFCNLKPPTLPLSPSAKTNQRGAPGDSGFTGNNKKPRPLHRFSIVDRDHPLFLSLVSISSFYNQHTPFFSDTDRELNLPPPMRSFSLQPHKNSNWQLCSF